MPGRRWSGALIAFGLLAIVGQASFPGIGNIWQYLIWGVPALWRIMLWGIPSVMLVAGAVGWESRASLVASRAGLTLGSASYAIYLLQGLIVWILTHTLPVTHFPIRLLLVTIASILVAIGSHAAFVRPVATLLRRLSLSWFGEVTHSSRMTTLR